MSKEQNKISISIDADVEQLSQQYTSAVKSLQSFAENIVKAVGSINVEVAPSAEKTANSEDDLDEKKDDVRAQN